MATLARIAGLPQGAMQVVGRGWFHLLGGLVLAVVLPVLVRYAGNPGPPQPGSAWNTIAGISLSVAVGFYVLTKVTRFPGVRATTYVLPCFAGAYALAMLIFFFFRIEYARSLFLGSFILCVLWFFHVILMTRLSARVAFAVVPLGSVARLRSVRTADFTTLASPTLPEPLPDALIADFRANLPGEWEHFIADWVVGGRPAYHVKDAMEMLTGRVDIEHLSENSFGSLEPALGYRNIKRIVDVLVAILLLPAFFLLTLVVGAAIALDSPGPVFFCQQRVGYRGRLFKVFKFRTMTHYSGAQAGDRHAAMTQAADPRVTRVGRFLRRSRIDEVPQLLNILRGEMSWIGPRPEAMALSAWYGKELPFYTYRHIVRPGITGWAQVNQGHVVEMHDVLGKLHYDFYYIKYFSPWLDAFIAIRTLWIMAGGQGAR